jgi:hypothetical protein
MPQPLGLHANDLFHRAQLYTEANAVLDVENNKKFLYPGFFMLTHALELALKSFLAARGTPKVEIRAYGHNLKKLHKACLELGLPEVEDVDHLVRHMARMNKAPDFAFRYPTGYFTSIPTPAGCLAAMEALLVAIGPYIVPVALKAQLSITQPGGGPILWTD